MRKYGASLKVSFIILVFFILLAALWLRLRLIDTTGIWGDQSFTLNTAMRWVNGGDIPLAANKSSVGIMNPPMIEYLYAAALLVWPDVLSVARLTLAAGMAALVLTAAATYRLFGWRAALWALLLFAFNPWSVLYSQLIWNQTMIPLFATLTLTSLLLYFAAQPRGVYLVLAFVGAACLTQVHPGSAVQLGTMALILLLFWWQLRWRPLLAGIACFTLLYVPFFLYEQGVGWMDVTAVATLSRQPSSWSAAAVLVSLDLLHAQGLLPTAALVSPLDHLMSLLLGLSLLYALGWGGQQFRQRHQDEQARQNSTAVIILLLWLVMPVLFYLRSSVHLQVYYLMGQWPAPFILMGLAIGAAQAWLVRPSWAPWGRWLNLGLTGLLALALAGQFALNIQIQNGRLADNEVQIRHIRQAISQVKQLMATRPECSLVLISEGVQLEDSRLSLLREFTAVPHILLADGELALPLPAPCALYLDARPHSRASHWLAETAVPLPAADIAIQEERWRFYELPATLHGQLIGRLTAEANPAAWVNGATLVNAEYGQVQPGAPLPLTLLWHVRERPPPAVYHVGNYLLTADNEVVAQSDGPGFDSIQWRPGDYFLTWFEIPIPSDLPAGNYRLALAQYTWPGLERINLTAGDNTYFGDDIAIFGD
jgi:4-amino-4-deoxy-L-arabinose transferase-like glycosyltransferase